MDPQQLGSGPHRLPEITDDNLQEAAPRVRALIMSRIEKMWAAVDQHIDEANAGDRMLDPRMLEIGKGLMKAEADIYRLGKPMPVQEEEEDQALAAVDRRAIVAGKLDELEAKRRAREQSQTQAQAS
jgi:hypothetical protein